MKYIQLGPKYLYYLGILVPTMVLCVLAIWLSEFAIAQQFESFVIVSIFAFIFLLRVLYCLKKYVYAKVDTVSKVLIFGTIFYENEIPLDQVKFEGSAWLFRTIIRIKIINRVYYVNTLGGNLKEQIDSII